MIGPDGVVGTSAALHGGIALYRAVVQIQGTASYIDATSARAAVTTSKSLRLQTLRARSTAARAGAAVGCLQCHAQHRGTPLPMAAADTRPRGRGRICAHARVHGADARRSPHRRNLGRAPSAEDRANRIPTRSGSDTRCGRAARSSLRMSRGLQRPSCALARRCAHAPPVPRAVKQGFAQARRRLRIIHDRCRFHELPARCLAAQRPFPLLVPRARQLSFAEIKKAPIPWWKWGPARFSREENSLGLLSIAPFAGEIKRLLPRARPTQFANFC